MPEDKRAFIQVTRGRCIVARFAQVTQYEFAVEHAANWEALEDQACAAVEDQAGVITGDGRFPCPDALVDLAEW